METPTLLLRLRTDTRPYHDALERNPFNRALAAGAVTPAATAHFLGRMHGLLQPCETQLRAHAARFGPAWQLDQRYRAPLILADLAALGHPAAPLPRPAAAAHAAAALGALYVLEGSALGGQVIARQLARAGVAGRAYFTGRAERTGPLWQSFCQQLAAAAPDDRAHAAVAASAVHTFQTLTAWLNH